MKAYNSYKFRTYRGAKEAPDNDNSPSDDNYDNGSTDGDLDGGVQRIREVYPRRGSSSRFRGGAKVRSSEFRSTRGEHRDGLKGRGGPKKGHDRDASENFYLLRKYPDSSLRHAEPSGLYEAKFYDLEKKTQQLKLTLPEDTRISKLLRRLSTESDPENSLSISKKLLEVLLLPDNSNYVRKAFHILGDSMFDILQVSPGPLAKHQAARALGRMGYILGQENDFDRYQTWLFLKMNTTYDEIQILLMKSLKETLAFERNKPVLRDHAEDLIHNLVTAIEVIESTDVFKATLDALVTLVEIYPESFYAQFQDTVDLLFGWHVDHTQSLTNIEFVSRKLQKISPHFKYNNEFAVSLIENFVEDIGNYGEDYDHVTVFMLALNTILKCLGDSFHPSVNKHVKAEFVVRCFEQIVRATKDALAKPVPHNNLVIAANESVNILLGYLESKGMKVARDIYDLIELELAVLPVFSTAAVVSMLLLVTKVIKELSANLPIELIQELLGPKSGVVALRGSRFPAIRDALISVYQALLNLKNISLLQEAYRYILGDLEVAFSVLVPDLKPFVTNNPFRGADVAAHTVTSGEYGVLFMLRCLSQLANASSIIVMWALKPTILELVGVELEPYSETLAREYPGLQYSLLYFLYSHCKCYNHFITSSKLVAGKQDGSGRFNVSQELNDVPSASPNLGNFEIILTILHRTLSVETTSEVTLLLIQWLNDIFVNLECYLGHLCDNDKFSRLAEIVVATGYSFDFDIAVAVCDTLVILLANKQVPWNAAFLTQVSQLCRLHLTSNVAPLRQAYAKLLANVPWDVAVKTLNSADATMAVVVKKAYNNTTVQLTQQIQLNNSVSGEMYQLQFKRFMGYVLNRTEGFNNETQESLQGHLEDVFLNSWLLQPSYKRSDFFYDFATNSRLVLEFWATLECAQLCVNCKLRTPLGKPNETFTKIENALNEIGNDLINVKKTALKTKNSSQRVRLLLLFVENLEKCIFNASEGCAIGMPPPAKQVRSFFIANHNTCKEWMSRIRTVIVHIALHSGDPSIALRHGQALLADLVAANKTATAEFEVVVMLLTLALLALKESEMILGLYVWCKAQGQKFPWVKFASDQAARRFEAAVDGYRSVETDSKEIRHFVDNQITNCYKETASWVELMNWSAETSLRNPPKQNGKKYWFDVTDWDCVNYMFNVEVGRQAFAEISSWGWKGEPESWSKYDELTCLESNLYGVALNIHPEYGKNESNLCRIEDALQYHVDKAPSEFLQSFILMQHATRGLHTDCEQPKVMVPSQGFEPADFDAATLRKVLWWSDYFAFDPLDPLPKAGNIPSFRTALRLEVVKRARKERNYDMALNFLNKFWKDRDMVIKDRNDVASCFLEKIPGIAVWTAETAKAISETIKLSYVCDGNARNTFNLCAMASTAISKHAELYGGAELKVISSKILLKLTKWLQGNEEVAVTDLSSPLGKLLLVLPLDHCDCSTGIIPTNDIAVGKLLRFSINQSKDMAKAWNYFGTWCYRWGRKMHDVQHALTEEEQAAVRAKLPANINQDDLNKVFAIIAQARNGDDDTSIENQTVSAAETVLAKLRQVDSLRDCAVDCQELIQIWKEVQRRVYWHYALSAESYFKYLQLTTGADDVSTDNSVVTVTLRLLRLIVKYALELQDTLEEGMAATPTQPWKVLIPQLFSRLNHPESYVCKKVSDLLCRIAGDAPHLITFPAVIGALQGGLKFDFSELSLSKELSGSNDINADLNDEEYGNCTYECDDSEDSEGNSLQLCFKTMVDTLSKQDPETIAQVQCLVKELRRITLLWDELWLGTLAQHQAEITKRQQQLEYEIDKVNQNPNLNKEEKLALIYEKHRIIVKPIVFVLEQLQEVTGVEAETPYEKQFQDTYLQPIANVLAKLKHPQDPEHPDLSFQPLKQLQKQLQHKFHRRSSYSLKMTTISPVLAGIKNTLIAMPGTKTTKVTISHVSNTVSILPTKTKPKKLVFYGSDGHIYTYLFKGLEDMHLDERIMQFLSIANTMMAHNTELGQRHLYSARHYSVIPLGPRSGLISWVDGTTPTFALYKRWQQRELAKSSIKNSSNGAGTSVLRPSEVFYNKLNPLLKQHGIKRLDNRKEWPLSVLKQVLTELMADTPSDLIAKELWCNAINANAWWQVVKKYSYSVAVMSMIGYIIGLGDRHLDNMLIDLNTGEVVHIDYNVCFEKGRTLRVPEKVPFRLTPNIQGALGVTGIEGIFRTACENVLKTMRKGRETILTLLETFVYDPLIDWTTTGEVLTGNTFGVTLNTGARQSKKALERDVTLSMYNVRCTEMKVEWAENKENIKQAIPRLVEKFQKWWEVRKRITDSEDRLQDLHQQMALVKEAEAHGVNKHNLHNLPARYETYCKTQEALKTAKKSLDKIVTDAEGHIAAYLKAMNSLDAPPVESSYGDCGIFELLKDFLQNAGKNDIVAQGMESESEVEDVLQQYRQTRRRVQQLLQDYHSILSQCPKSFTEDHRMALFMKWSKYLLETKNVAGCDLVYDKFRTHLDFGNAKAILQYYCSLEACYKDTVTHANRLYEELTRIRIQESSETLEKLYGNARIGVSSFLAREKGAVPAFKFVVANELVMLNKNFLTLETTASRSGDLLIKLTRDGDWFLDDLVLSSTRAVEMVNNLPLNESEEDESFLKVLSGIRIANGVYKGLHELHFNFHTIILPESVKKIQSEEPSVLQMIADLKGLLEGHKLTITEIIGQLEKVLACLYMQMDINPSYEAVLQLTNSIRVQFHTYMQTQQSDTLTPGKMLLMGFNGLFDKLRLDMNTLVTVLGTLEVPQAWRKLDQVKEAKAIAAHIFDAKVYAVLDDIFMLKKLQAMISFFGLVVDNSAGHGTVLSDEQMVRPVRQFIADFISGQLLGITTECVAYVVCFLLQSLNVNVANEIEQKDIGAESKVPLDELCHKSWNYLLKQGVLSQNIVSQASSFSLSLKSAWDQIQEPKKIEFNIAMVQSSALRLQSQISIYAFVHEEVLTQCSVYATTRGKFVEDLKGEMTALKMLHAKLSEAKERQDILIENAYQRLKWAQGANPSVSEISSAFETAVSTRNIKLTFELNFGVEFLSLSKVVLQHEVLRTRCAESKGYEKLFVSALEKWRLACQYAAPKNSEVLSSTEESIMNLLTPDLLGDPKWLQEISDVISAMIITAQKKLEDEKSDLFCVFDALSVEMEKLRRQYDIHSRLMSDIKVLLKAMAKLEDFNALVQYFIANYRQFVDNFALLSAKFKKELTGDSVRDCLEYLQNIQRQLDTVYDGLLALREDGNPNGSLQQLRQLGQLSHLQLTKQEGVAKEQQKNAFALGVWHRVKMKLEGRDPDPGRKYTPQEQVDYVIQEATNLDNLALLYEGWTPWV